jgi:hypothetical protein
VITSNRTREVHDALKRRCLYQWMGYPGRDRELQIVARARSGDGPATAGRRFHPPAAWHRPVQGARHRRAIDWCRALAALGVTELDPQSVRDTLGVLLKYQDDLARADGPTIAELLAGAPGRLTMAHAAPSARQAAPHALPMLARNVTHFMRLLRGAGFGLSPAHAVDALDALRHVDIGARDEVRAALAALVLSGPSSAVFDAAFDLFWRDPDWEGKLRAMLLPRVDAGAPPPKRSNAWPTRWPHGSRRAETGPAAAQRNTSPRR